MATRRKRRAYDMTVRGAQLEDTRRRILAAAISVYGRSGFTNTTMQAVAHEAHVAPTTVLNHFATPDALMTAAITALLEDLRLPEAGEIAALPTVDARLRRLAGELAAF